MNLKLLKVRTAQFILAAGLFSFVFTAQAQQADKANTQADAAYSYESGTMKSFHNAATKGTPSGTVAKNAAMWDLQFNYDIDAATGAAGQAGAIYTGTEFWVSRWATDSVFSFDTTGTLTSRFVIPGAGMIRGMTKDAMGDIWISNATRTIRQISPTTKSILSSVTVPASAPVARFITFDPTADGGNGGFYIADFNTPITLVSMAGAVLSSIPVATHTLGGMYGAAVDNISGGGPYLWVFSQPGNPGALISQIALPAGTPTGITFDVNADLA